MIRFALAAFVLVVALSLACADDPFPSIETVPPGIEPAVSELPAAGVCQDPAAGDVVTFTLESDVPRPRCGQVRPDQHLRFVNETGETVEVHLALYNVTIAPGASGDIEAPVGSYLASGVHDVKSRLYAGTGPEVVVLQE